LAESMWLSPRNSTEPQGIAARVLGLRPVAQGLPEAGLGGG